MRAGKLTPNELKQFVINNVGAKRAEVIRGAAIGEDCGAFSIDGEILITSDPITAAGSNCGTLAMYISSNDIAAAGGEPVIATLTLMVPCDTAVEAIGGIMQDANNAARKLGVEIIGGHTEFTSAVVRPVVAVTMLGKAGTGFCRVNVGDDIVMTKSAGIEGAAILACDYGKALGLTDKDIERAHTFTDMLDVLSESRIAMKAGGVCLMHDITEGGVYGAISELCFERGFGASIDAAAIEVDELTARICSKLDINPYGLISSGSLLIVCKDGNKIVSALEGARIKGKIIGKITNGDGAYAIQGTTRLKLEVESDEFLRAQAILERNL